MAAFFPDDIFKSIFFNENVQIFIKMSLNSVPKAPINNIPALVQIMAWRRPGDKPLSEPMVVSLLTHICVTRPQWVNDIITSYRISRGVLTFLIRCRVTAEWWEGNIYGSYKPYAIEINGRHSVLVCKWKTIGTLPVSPARVTSQFRVNDQCVSSSGSCIQVMKLRLTHWGQVTHICLL